MPSRLHAVLLSLVFAVPIARAEEPSRTPRELIDRLGVEIRQILETSGSSKTPDDAERAVADQIKALIQTSGSHPSLIDADGQGRTPLMVAASDGYALVVRALLADPGVRQGINAPDSTGETAWMLANFAPSLTLVACQPGNLTAERNLLMPPYLRRMAHLMKTHWAALEDIVHALEDAGAQAAPQDAKRVWLAHCPNATPDLRQALAEGELMSTLINEAVTRQISFNKAVRENPASVPANPPDDMKFSLQPKKPIGEHGMDPMICERMPKVEISDPNRVPWGGHVSFKIEATTRAGVVETVDFELLPARATPSASAISFYRRLVLRALAGYQCLGPHIFKQEFNFRGG